MSELIQLFENFQTKTGDSLKGLDTKIDLLQKQVDEFNAEAQRKAADPGRGTGKDPASAIVRGIAEHKTAFQQTGRFRFEVPTTLESKSFASTGLVNPQTYGTIGTDGGWGYGNVRALFRAVPAGAGSVFQIRETDSSGWNASPQSETSAKNESTATLTADTLTVQTIAHWVQASRQALDDVEGLAEFIRGRLLWGLAAEIDEQLIGGDGNGQNLLGLTNLATAFDLTLLNAAGGWDRYFVAGAAAAQVRKSGFNPNFMLVHPYDAFRMGFTRDDEARYLTPPPGLPPIVQTTAISEGTFVCGDSSQGMIRVRQTATIDLSESHDDFFVRNLVAIRAEERMLFQVTARRAFVTGSFNTSPA